MPCEYCSPDAESCSVCETYNDPARKSYSRWVSGCILVIFGVIGLVAGMCWIINQVGGVK